MAATPFLVEQHKAYSLMAKVRRSRNPKVYFTVEEAVRVEGGSEETRRLAIQRRGRRLALYVLADDGEILPVNRRWLKDGTVFVEVRE